MTDERALRLSALAERDLDLLFLEEFHVSPGFRRWFLAKLDAEAAEKASFVGGWQGVYQATGESDLELDFALDGRTLRLLIENKIGAEFQPDQVERYRERAETYCAQGEASRCFTTLLAPAKYIDARTEVAAGFDAQVSYEEVRDWFLRDGEDNRAQYRARVLEEACEQSGRGYVVQEVEEHSAFWRQYWELQQREFPELKMKAPGAKGQQSSWIYFHPTGTAWMGGPRLAHKTYKGRVDLMVFFPAEGGDELEARLHENLEEEMTAEKAKSGKSLLISLPVAALSVGLDFESQIGGVRAGMQAATRLWDWYRSLGI